MRSTNLRAASLLLCALIPSVVVSLSAVGPKLHAQEPTYDTLESAAPLKDFQLQGEYVAQSRALQAVALGESEFELVLFEGGLPGAGWDRSPPRKQTMDSEQLEEFLADGGFQKVMRESPTLGAKPPQGAVVLFDGTQQSLDEHWEAGARLTQEGLLMQGATSRDRFENYTLHLEFRTPFMPMSRGQGRGNSGVYHQGRFETQVLDSFGLDGKMNETGGLYSVRDPDLNMCFPPLSWQTYDVDFTAATFDAAGNKLVDPKITVRLNGVVVQQEVFLPHTTTAAPFGDEARTGPIFLQDHGNPVSFRNIWVKPRDMAQEARQPRLPAFERLFALSEPQPLGGHLLVSELGCTNCHSAANIDGTRQAPVLSTVGKRLRADYLLEYLQDPHGVKQGTTMPDLLAHLAAPEKQEVAAALASFLIDATGNAIERKGNPRAITRGDSLFHTIGCTACHASQRRPELASTSVPLGDLGKKYVLDGLTTFLQQPHSVRPSGRMPTFNLSPEQALDIATYLLRDEVVGEGVLNVQAKFYTGSWDKLPDFAELTPYLATNSFDFDVTASGRTSDFAAQFETKIIIPKDGTYRISIGSDDGSRLFIDNVLVVDNDGVHPMQFETGEVSLSQGIHDVRAEYFEKGGEEVMEVDIEGPDLPRTNLGSIATLDPEATVAERTEKQRFQVVPSLVEKGRQLFETSGCAACHQLEIDGTKLRSQTTVKAFAALDMSQGCMAESATNTAPKYDLSPAQRDVIASFGTATHSALDEATQLHLKMASLNCYACHSRGGIGGPEAARNDEFQTTMKEMGDEGRVPPPLNGAGDKLKRNYVERIVTEGVDERPYMLVNMPGFGVENSRVISQLLAKLDEQTVSLPNRPEVSDEKLKSDGRLLVGDKGLSCVKCHTFGGEGAPGIQALDLQRMNARLRENWFHRYLLSPTTFRPGTRMPASFPDGKSVLPDLYGGEPGKQIHAMWDFLSDGRRARVPLGVQQETIELIPSERPVIYRNFLQGLTPRGIAVGYPEDIHLAWDANRMALGMIWKGAFIDASRHWVGRGPGNQGPLGDDLINLESTAPVARLESPTSHWPGDELEDAKFLGYRLNAHGQPTFRYRLGEIDVEDEPLPKVNTDGQQSLVRILKLSGNLNSVYLRAAKGSTIIPSNDGTYRIDDRYTLRLSLPATIRTEGDHVELIVAIDSADNSALLEQEIIW